MRRHNKYNIVLIILSLLLWTENATSNGSLQDQIFIHTSKAYYVTGDLLQYKVYLPESFHNSNKVLRICMSRSDSYVINQSYQRIENRSSFSGEINIPLDLTSDVYYIVITGFDVSLKKEVILAQASIPIYSDLSGDLQLTNNTQLSNLNSQSDESGPIAVILDTDQVKRRENVKGTISFSNNKVQTSAADISMTINDVLLDIPTYKRVHNSPGPDAIQINNLSDRLFISGVIKNSDLNAPKKFQVIGVYAKEENEFYYLQTAEDGRFHLALDDFNGDKPLQFINYGKEPISVELSNPSITEGNDQLIVTDEILSNLELSRKRKKINQLFNPKTNPKQIKQSQWEKKEIRNSKSFDFRKYEAFESISAFFTEILSALKFEKSKDETTTAKVFNRERASRGFYKGTPIFIVDGMITKDATFVDHLDFSKLNTIDIVSELETLRSDYGAIGLNGIIYLTTSLPEVRLPEAEADDVFIVKGFTSYSKDPKSDVLQSSKETPIFDSNIHWTDQLNLTKDGVLSFEFMHTDDLGEFEIEVISRTPDGKLHRSTTIYEVN